MRLLYCLFLILICSQILSAQIGNIVLKDKFSRELNSAEITLVDWEGYLANPAIKLTLFPPQNAAFPATAILAANNPRLYFNQPSSVGIDGPSKSIAFANSDSIDFYLSIWPDRDTLDEQHLLKVSFTDANSNEDSLSITIDVIDQDANRALDFTIHVDFTQDPNSYNFFADTSKRNVVLQAADDWAYFIGDMNLNFVPAGDEPTWLWYDDYSDGFYVNNAFSYTGYLLYAYGIHTAPHRSGGEPSLAGGFQYSGTTQLPLKRSGGYQAEIHGNYNTLGWYILQGDDDWFHTRNFGDEQNDLYSIALHEMGHALCFNPGYPIFDTFKTLGYVQDSAVFNYHGAYPQIDQFDHLDGEVDRISMKGAYGNEYYGYNEVEGMPLGRWIITKLNILCLQAIGYQLRETSALTSPNITTAALPQGMVSVFYMDTVKAEGGIPFYKWSIESGSLPPGLTLNSFTGTISGIPTQSGTFDFVVRLDDYDTEFVTAPLSIIITQVTGVEDNAQAPETFSLLQNYPNPFNPSTTIRFSIAPGGTPVSQVELTIYNIPGQRIKTLLNDKLESGEYEVKWDGRNDQNQRVSSGLYLYKMIIENRENQFTATRKMLLVR